MDVRRGSYATTNPMNEPSAPDISLLKDDVRVVQPFEVVLEDGESDYDGQPRRVVYRNANQDPATAEGRFMVQDELDAIAASSATAKKDQQVIESTIRAINSKAAEPDFTMRDVRDTAVSKPFDSQAPSNHYDPNEFMKYVEPHKEYQVSEYKCTDYQTSDYKSIYE
jgi:hypothetical protein